MKKRRFLALVLASVMVTSNITWAGVPGQREKDRAKLETLYEKATSSNAGAAETATGSNAAASSKAQKTALRTARTDNPSVTQVSEQDLKEYIKDHPFFKSRKDTWTVTPDAANEKPGKLSEESVQNALNTLNFIRYVAGLSEVGSNETYEEFAQTGTTLLQRIGKLEHRPAKPDGMSQAFFDKGYKGTSSSNLGQGYSNLVDAILRGWMEDGDSSNIAEIGHRRWCLDPYMEETGFGHSGSYYSMYSIDGSSHRGGSTGAGINYIPWPAQTMPVNFFSGPWSVLLNSGIYRTTDNIVVVLTNRGTGENWMLDSSCQDVRGKYFNIAKTNIGCGPAIVFNPGVKFKDGDVIDVKITGLKDTSGNDVSLQYSVDFCTIIPLENIEIRPSSAVVNECLDYGLTLLLNPADATDVSVSDAIWTSSDKTVATVDKNGVVTGVSAGTATITAELDGKTAVCEVTVRRIPLEAVRLKQESVTIRKNMSQSLEAQLVPTDATDARIADINWSSSDHTIVTVTPSGSITGKSAGKATVTVELNGKKASCQVTVVVPLTGIAFSSSGTKTINKGETADLIVQPVPADATDFDANAVTWTTSDSKTATVNRGKVTGISGGTAKITANYKNWGISSYVTVVVPMNGIRIHADTTEIGPGEQISLQAMPTPEDATDFNNYNVTWTSDDPGTATVTQGRVTGVKEGTVTIRAVYDDGHSKKTAACQVTVKKIIRLQNIKLNVNSRTMNIGKIYKVTPTLVPADANDASLNDIKWSSSNENVATVDSNGTIFAHNTGTARITAELKGKKAVCTVTVNRTGSSSGGGGGSSGGGSGSSGGGSSSSGGSGSSGGGSSSGGSSGSSGGGSSAGGSGSSGGGSSAGSKETVAPGGPSGSPADTSLISLPDYVITGNWSEASGQWQFRDSSGLDYRNMWGAIYNPYANTAGGQSAFDWFRFNAAGNMLTGWFLDADGCYYYLNPDSDGTRGRMLTGWVWIADASGIQRCCYLNPNSDGYRGRLITNAIVDGYTVNAEGYWVVNGVIQTK